MAEDGSEISALDLLGRDISIRPQFENEFKDLRGKDGW